MNDLHCPQSFVKSIAPLSVSPSLHLYCLSNIILVCLCFIFLRILHVCGVVILSTYPNHQSLRCTTLCKKVLWLPNTCLMSSFLTFCGKHLYLILIFGILDFTLILLTSY